jgi:hypothetical protein
LPTASGTDLAVGDFNFGEVTALLIVAPAISMSNSTRMDRQHDLLGPHLQNPGLGEAFPDLAAVADGTLPPQELREKSLLGSVGMLRILAAVYCNLTERGADSQEVTDFFHSLSPKMAAPVTDASVWRKGPKTSGSFELGANAPVMRQQNLSYIVDAITSWYKK